MRRKVPWTEYLDRRGVYQGVGIKAIDSLLITMIMRSHGSTYVSSGARQGRLVNWGGYCLWSGVEQEVEVHRHRVTNQSQSSAPIAEYESSGNNGLGTPSHKPNEVAKFAHGALTVLCIDKVPEYGVRGKLLRIPLPSNHVTVGEGVGVCWVCSGSPERSPEISKWRKCGGDPARVANWIINTSRVDVAMTSFCKFLQILQTLQIL